MKRLWKLSVYFGRSGRIFGLFVATDEQIEKIKSQEIHLGEALGKHSEVILRDLTPQELFPLPISEEILNQILESVPDFGCGFNLTNYIEDEEE